MTLNEYIESLKNRRVTVIGAGVSNRPLIKLLCQAGIVPTVCDRSTELHPDLEGLALNTSLGEGYLDALNADVIFRTPGLHPDVPPLRAARQAGAFITSEMEVFMGLCPCRIIAVTGSDGKTTTTSLIAQMLRDGGYRVHVGGNIGKPLLAEIPDMRSEDIVVLELSSFQLHSMTCAPDVAVITNLAPNHLDVHPSYADYVGAKKQIFLHQRPDSLLVLNADNADTASCAPEAAGRVCWFSRKRAVENGVYLAPDGNMIRAENGSEHVIMPASDIRLPGVHNIENTMAAFAAVSALLPDEALRHTAATFAGVAHRLETVRVLHGVRFINDSIASSPSRTEAGLRCFDDKLILIAGGKDKGVPFDDLGPLICEHVKSLYLTGPTSDKIKAAVENAAEYQPGAPAIHCMDDFTETVRAAAAEATEGDIVLLSPASTSFDRFKNFEERGNTFRKIVEELK